MPPRPPRAPPGSPYNTREAAALVGTAASSPRSLAPSEVSSSRRPDSGTTWAPSSSPRSPPTRRLLRGCGRGGRGAKTAEIASRSPARISTKPLLCLPLLLHRPRSQTLNPDHLKIKLYKMPRHVLRLLCVFKENGDALFFFGFASPESPRATFVACCCFVISGCI